jgi:hypothetical protein
MNQNLTLVERFTAPTPRFFAIIRNIGVALGSVSVIIAYLVDQNFPIPDLIYWIGDKATALSAIIAAIVSQFTVDYKKKAEAEALNNIK